MTYLRGKINKAVDFRKSPEYNVYLKKIVVERFQSCKDTLLKDLLRHPVTREIQDGINASNLSNTLGGQGNLFSFIGFEQGDKPIEVIKKAIEDITITQTMINKDGSSQSYIMYPSVQELFDITPLPWASGRSWAEGIEKGISNLGYFLASGTRKSRSGKGIQSDHPISKNQFSPKPYLSPMIFKFEKCIHNLNNLVLR